MLSQDQIRTIYIILAVIFELMIAMASSVYLKFGFSFFLVVLTTLIAIVSMAYFILNHSPDGMK